MHPDMCHGSRTVSSPAPLKSSLTLEERGILAAAMGVLFKIAETEDVVASLSSQADPIGLLIENFIQAW